MASLSFRNRLLLAAALWTAGLFIIGVIVSTALMLRFKSWPYIMHHTAWTHATVFSIMAAVFMIIGLSQVRSALSSLNRLRTRLAAVHAGQDAQVAGSYPAEVQPLVDDLNALLEHRAQMVHRALAKAGDLAHGLKTPLAVMSHEAERAANNGQGEFAEVITQQVERMRRQVEYHLAHARAAASGAQSGARSSVLSSAEGLSRALQRLHAARGLALNLNVSDTCVARVQREDLDEMLGNLLDNACKWARSRVVISSTATDSTIVILVDDDGAGLDASLREAVLQRGVRADESPRVPRAAAGSGFGLAIVRDLAELYGGSIELDASPAGGLRALLKLPGA